MFSIEVSNLHWIEGVDEREDLCLHGDAVVLIGHERLEYQEATVSATALYLLKSLSEDHIIYKSIQMLPCCGFTMFADDALSSVEISGCPNGVDWSVIHGEDCIWLVTESGNKTTIPMDEYRKTVFAFADQIEAFYRNSADKKLPRDKFDRDGYIAFWNEWKARRYE